MCLVSIPRSSGPHLLRPICFWHLASDPWRVQIPCRESSVIIVEAYQEKRTGGEEGKGECVIYPSRAAESIARKFTISAQSALVGFESASCEIGLTSQPSLDTSCCKVHFWCLIVSAVLSGHDVNELRQEPEADDVLIAWYTPHVCLPHAHDAPWRVMSRADVAYGMVPWMMMYGVGQYQDDHPTVPETRAAECSYWHASRPMVKGRVRSLSSCLPLPFSCFLSLSFLFRSWCASRFNLLRTTTCRNHFREGAFLAQCLPGSC